jgi:aerobic carbon-monoxide dehydrogenase medium subunit
VALALHTPTSLDEACQLLADAGGDARAIAGGTALVLLLRSGLVQNSALVRLDRIPDLDGITVEGDLLRIGAMTTLRALGESPVVQQRLPVLAGTCRLVGNVRVRNAATIGGNVCEADYASDPPGVLVALGARARVQSPRGSREIPVAELISDFYETSLASDELVSEVVVPLPAAETNSVYLKYITRSSEDRPCVGATGIVRVDAAGNIADLRAAVGGIAGKPLRLPDVEAQGHGQAPSEELFRAIGEQYAAAADPVDDVRGSTVYRKRMVAVFVRRALQAAAAGQVGAWKV